MKWLILVLVCFFTACNSSNVCNYTTYPGNTNSGPTMPTSGQASAAVGEDCAAQCCNMPGCYACSWTIVTSQCWFFNNNTAQTYKPVPTEGVNYWMVNSKSLCTSNCPQNVTGNNKRGLAYSYTSELDMSAIRIASKWWYNWDSSPSTPAIQKASQDLDMEFVPMLWNGNFNVSYVISQIAPGTKYILGFNEPNFFSQGNLSPTKAASLWPKIEQIANAKNLQIVGPAVNYCGPSSACWDTDPYAYLDAFFAACTNCRVDFVAAHLYSCNAPFLNHYIGGFRKYNRSLWLTEFSCGDNTYTEKQQLQYMQQALAILDADSHVFRYSWFSGRTTEVANANLLGATGELTELGVLYTTQNLEGAAPNGSEWRYNPFGIWYLFLVLVISLLLN